MNKSFLLVLGAVLGLLSSPVSAQLQCINRDVVQADLKKNGYFLSARGLQNDGNVLEIHSNENGGFIVILLIPNVSPNLPAICAHPITSGEYWYNEYQSDLPDNPVGGPS
jgi:hypothetical protein